MRPKLTSDDVRMLVKLRNWVRLTDDHDTRLAGLKLGEAALSDAARHWWFKETADALTAELKHWKRAYRTEKTRNGYRVFPLLTTRGVYRVKPLRTGLTREAVKEYLELVRIKGT